MFRQHDFSNDVADIQALLGEQDTGVPALDAALLDGPPQERLTRIRQAIVAQQRPPARLRTWWPSRPQRRHRRLLISCVAVPALLAATAAGWAIASSPPASRLTYAIVCYSLPHPPEAGISESAAGGTPDGLPPVTMCARQWAAGMVVSGDHQVPATLTACALPQLGEIGVFPDTTCAALRLPPLPPGYDQAAKRFAAFNTALSWLTGSGARSRCVAEPAALSYIRQTAQKYGFSGWRIVPPGHVGWQRCWQAQSDPATHIVEVVPQPGQNPPSDAGVESIIRTTLSRPIGACERGSAPENAAATAAKLQRALRAAGYGSWQVIIRQHTSRSEPCYEQVLFPLGNRRVVLDPVAMTGTTF